MTSVFHICSDFAKQALYGELLREVSKRHVQQFMYVPVRTAAELGHGEIGDDPTIRFRFEHLLRPHHRLLFRTKVRRVLRDICDHTPVRDANLVHAHFLYSDGAVALRIKQCFGTPFIVAVRNTDVNSFQRFRPDLAGIRDEVLQAASRVVFLSPTYRDAFIRRLIPGIDTLVAAKSLTVPNGLGDEWLMDMPKAFPEPAKTLRLLYVGDFTPNKNVPGLVTAVQLLRQHKPTTLTIVGGGGDERGTVARLLEQCDALGIDHLGRVNDRQRLKAIYRSHDVFVMPSFHETFGLSYVEAMSQGVPIVHSRGQGVDGYFELGTVSAAVDPTDAASIAAGIMEVSQRLPSVRSRCVAEARRFSWDEVSRIYAKTYQDVLAT